MYPKPAKPELGRHVLSNNNNNNNNNNNKLSSEHLELSKKNPRPNKLLRTTKDNLAGYSTHFEEGIIKLKNGYPLAPQDHGLVSALKIISKH